MKRISKPEKGGMVQKTAILHLKVAVALDLASRKNPKVMNLHQVNPEELRKKAKNQVQVPKRKAVPGPVPHLTRKISRQKITRDLQANPGNRPRFEASSKL